MECLGSMVGGGLVLPGRARSWPGALSREVDQAVRIAGPGGCWVSADRSQLGMHRVHAWIGCERCRGSGRSHVVMTRVVGHLLALGLYAADGADAGFARLATDRATFAR